jgi:iron(III) transport system permease protein
VLALAVALIPPLSATGYQLFANTSAWGLLTNARLWWLLLRSLGLSISVTALALALGITLGLLYSRAEFPLKRLLFATHVGVVFLPPFLPALGWFHIFGLEGLLGGSASTRLLFSEFGVVMALVGCLTPVVTVLTNLGMSGVDPALEDAARIVATPWRTAGRILVPCAMPSIALSGIVVFVLAFSELGVPMFLRVDVYPTVVFTRLGGMDFAPGEAVVLTLPLVLVALAVLWLERRVAGRRAIAALGSPLRPRATLFRFQPWMFIVVALASAASTLPVVALLFLKPSWLGLLELPRWVGDAPFNSLRAGLCAALGMSALAVVLGHAVARRNRIALWLDGATTLAFILPASIVGVGIALAWNRPTTDWLYGSFGILVLGYFTRYSALATRVFAAAVAQVPVSFEEAAWSVGARYFRRLALLMGLLRRGCFGAFAVALVFCLRDLETAALFYPPGGEPLTVRIFTLEANGPPEIVSCLAGLHIVMTFAAVGLSWFLLHKRPTR